MYSLLEKYEHKGSFNFAQGDSLASKSKEVPNLPGIYLIFTIKNKIKTLVYIGKSGTMVNNGGFKKQLLKKRLNNLQDGIKRQDYFTRKLISENVESLEIQRYITFNDTVKDVPGYVEGALIQEYYNQHHKLPLWNKDF